MDPFFLWLESTAFSVWVRESTSVFAFPIILSMHTIGMGFVAGLSTAIALRILGLAPKVPLLEMGRLFPLVWAAFWLNAVSGLVLLIAYPTKALTNPVFYLKLVFVGIAVWAVRSIHQHVFGNVDLDFSPVQGRGKTLAAILIFCWVGAITAGRLLAYTYSKLTTL
jgi:hypothetical protein